MSNFTQSRQRHTALCLVLSLAAACAAAGPTYEQVQDGMVKVAIPDWTKAAGQAKALRASRADAEAFAAWAALDADTDARSGKAPLSKVTTPRDAREMTFYLGWLRAKVLADNADGRYSYALAFNLAHQADPDAGTLREAAVFLLHARLALDIDGARCVDRSSPAHLSSEFESQPQLRALSALVARMVKADRAAATLDAVSIERMRGERPPALWLCSLGVQTTSEAIHVAKNTDPATPPGQGSALAALGKSGVAADRGQVKPALISEAAWRKDRAERIEFLIRSVLADF